MSEQNTPYRVLARKYRPQNFEELIGQDALVRTLKNAIQSGRIAHAFMLTGVRGVGKTTTARIIAKALNYVGPNGSAGPTTGDTSDCKLCQAISEDRHPDVIEMDAASRTGVDDIREILDGVRYAPTEARYKVYIIDEVHMLSKQAFNALLKTLEEPPEHVKFIFATTEIRKVPITVLSRCQRFDLRRVDVPTLMDHFKNICAQEKVEIEEDAVALVARAADGSVRDGLSLLDQAIALAGEKITGQQIQDMLGLADRARNMDLLERALTGDMPEALEIMDELYRSGADPVVLVQDLLDLTHILTKLRAVPAAGEMKHAMAADEVKRAGALAGNLSMPTLGKTWQILLKGLGEVQSAPNPQSAAEMVIIRLAYAADLPDPKDLIKKLSEESGDAPAISTSSPSEPPPPPREKVSAAMGGGAATNAAPAPEPQPQTQSIPETETAVHSLADVVSVLEGASEVLLAGQVYQYAHLVKFEQGRIEMRPAEHAPPKMTQDLGRVLSAVTNMRWVVSISGAAGAPTLAEQAEAARQQEVSNILQMPVMKEVMEVFPEAELVDIIELKKD
ncbi:MAG: DNA polymerase III subunit gamma/tau [Alphaproteobacteria bacterium]|nr:DNA polymerase III subunit gamma/tau [Alphaproteobacteria bacterium]